MSQAGERVKRGGEGEITIKIRIVDEWGVGIS